MSFLLLLFLIIFNVFFGVPHLATYNSLFSVNQDWVFTGFDPGMALTQFPFSIWKRQDSNPQPSNCEPCLLTTTPSSHSNINVLSKLFPRPFLS